MKTTHKGLKYTQYTILKNKDIIEVKNLLKEIEDMIAYNELEDTINFKLYDASYYLYNNYNSMDAIDIFNDFCELYYRAFIDEVDHLDITLIQFRRTSNNYIEPGTQLYYEDYVYYTIYFSFWSTCLV